MMPISYIPVTTSSSEFTCFPSLACDFLLTIFTPDWVDHSGVIYKCFLPLFLHIGMSFVFKALFSSKGRNTISTICQPSELTTLYEPSRCLIFSVWLLFVWKKKQQTYIRKLSFFRVWVTYNFLKLKLISLLQLCSNLCDYFKTQTSVSSWHCTCYSVL